MRHRSCSVIHAPTKHRGSRLTVLSWYLGGGRFRTTNLSSLNLFYEAGTRTTWLRFINLISVDSHI